MIDEHLATLNANILRDLGERIAAINTLLPTDTNKIMQIKEYSDLDVTRELMKAAKKTEAEIYAMYDDAARESVEYSRRFYKALNKPFVPYANNPALQGYVQALAKQTVDEMRNMTQTTGFMVYTPDRKKVFTSLSRTYQKTLDEATIAATTGTTDYYSSMRRTIKDLADSGLRTQYRNSTGSAGAVVDYANGYYRRLDTAVRQNILWGIKTCNQGISDITGQEYGADGYEIDYHSNPRPSHAEMGGKRYSAGKAVTIDGVHYPSISSVEHLLGEYGCLHVKYSVVLGLSYPLYEPEELRQYKETDKRVIEFEGNQYTGYEATQIQRKLETSIRNARDRQTIARAAGDGDMVDVETLRIKQLTHKYVLFSNKAGLSVKTGRVRKIA